MVGVVKRKIYVYKAKAFDEGGVNTGILTMCFLWSKEGKVNCIKKE